MRTIRTSVTFTKQLHALLAHGLPRYGATVVRSKKARVFKTIRSFIAHYPHGKRAHPALGLVIYPVDKTPFVVLYDFDDTEIRIHFILHKRADTSALDPASVEW
jgi:hypothetical protein